MGAACARAGIDPVLRDVFTTELPTPDDGAAVAVCQSCPVRAECAAYAGTLSVSVGIWAGQRAGGRQHHRASRSVAETGTGC